MCRACAKKGASIGTLLRRCFMSIKIHGSSAHLSFSKSKVEEVSCLRPARMENGNLSKKELELISLKSIKSLIV